MKIIIWLMLFLPTVLHAQVWDDFSDGNFTADPCWVGDTAVFKVNTQKQLQLNSSGAGTSCLATAAGEWKEKEWSFWIKMSFNTSLNNFARIYLGADSPDLAGEPNGIYLQAGGSGDSLVLYTQKGGVPAPLFTYPQIRTGKTVNALRIRICRDSTATWNMYADSTGGTGCLWFGSFTFRDSLPSEWFGVYCRYTSSNSEKFWFDDIYCGALIYDSVSPAVEEAGFSDSLNIRLKFSEFIDPYCLNGELKYSLKNNPEILREAYILPGIKDVLFIRINRTETDFFCDSLKIENISDYSGNLLADTSVLLCYYIPGECSKGDVVINEVLFDPVSGGAAFIEVFNRSQKVIDLNRLSAGVAKGGESSFKYLRLYESERMLNPGGYFVLTSDAADLCNRYNAPYPERLQGSEQFPSMDPDSGSVCIISDNFSVPIDSMSYAKSMQLAFLKTTEGVSLERLDPESASGSRANWQSASETSGFASPGYGNSHYTASEGNGLEMELSSPYISPDNDGIEDLLFITVKCIEPGTMVSLRIFDASGNIIATPAIWTSAAENNRFVWDGTTGSRKLVPMGWYVVFAESVSVSGHRSCQKRAVAVVQKLN